MLLESFDANVSPAAVVDVLRRDGGVIVRDLAPAGLIDACAAELRSSFNEYDEGQRTDFSGAKTLRCGGVLRYAPSCAALIAHPMVLAVADAILLPSCAEYQIGSTTGVEILPGESEQQLHRDDTPYPIQVAGFELQIGVMWAFNDFTAENGATRVVPGSHRWDWERKAEDAEIAQAVMPRGSVMFYTGSVVHSGGENRTQSDRIAMNLTYCNAWLRQEENQYMTCPPDLAAKLAPELRALIGYTMGHFALGYYAPPRFMPGTPGTLPPEMAFETGPWEDMEASILSAQDRDTF